MTDSLSRPLSIPLLLSGSVHLGLLALLLVGAKEAAEIPVEIQLIEVPSQAAGQVAPEVRISKSQKKSPAKVVDPVPAVQDDGVSEVKLKPQPSSSGPSPEELSAEELYKAQIARELNARKFYPPIAKRLRQQGRVIVQFNVTREGKVLEAKVVQPSPFKTLNQSARNLVESVKGLNPFPDEIKKTTWLFQVPVDYQM